MPEPTPEAWAQIRYDYEQTSRPVVEICFEHGITANTLRSRGRRWGWKLRRARIAAEGPPAAMFVQSVEPYALQLGEPPREQSTASMWLTPSPTLPLSGGGSREASGGGSHEASGGGSSEEEPSPHIGVPSAPAAGDALPIGERLEGAVGRVLPAIEMTLARLTAGPIQPREMELAARALGSLTRTLRELNGLLNQHSADEPRRSTEELRASVTRKLAAIAAEQDDDPPPDDMDEFRNELAGRIKTFVESRQAEIPAKYEAAWNEFAAEAGQSSAAAVPPNSIGGLAACEKKSSSP